MLDAVLLAVALAMDATAVAAGRGVIGLRQRDAVLLATSFGVFQAAMAALGWWIGATAQDLVASFDHWIAFALLALIGGKMLYEAFHAHAAERPAAPLDLKSVVVLSLATSIDAMAAGVTLPILSVPVVVALVLIGAVSLVSSLIGAFAGAALGARFGTRLEAFGGLTLIGIGVKTLIDHLT